MKGCCQSNVLSPVCINTAQFPPLVDCFVSTSRILSFLKYLANCYPIKDVRRSLTSRLDYRKGKVKVKRFLSCFIAEVT